MQKELKNIGNYLAHGIAGVFNECDFDKEFTCSVQVVRVAELIKCDITLTQRYRDFPLSEVTIYLRDMEDSSILIKQMDLYIPYACSRLMRQIAEKSLLDENFREFHHIALAEKLIKESEQPKTTKPTGVIDKIDGLDPSIIENMIHHHNTSEQVR